MIPQPDVEYKYGLASAGFLKIKRVMGFDAESVFLTYQIIYQNHLNPKRALSA